MLERVDIFDAIAVTVHSCMLFPFKIGLSCYSFKQREGSLTRTFSSDVEEVTASTIYNSWCIGELLCVRICCSFLCFLGSNSCVACTNCDDRIAEEHNGYAGFYQNDNDSARYIH